MRHGISETRRYTDPVTGEVVNGPGRSLESSHARTGLALVVIMIGVLMAAVDTTIVVLALPELETSLHVSLSGVIWVIIGYLLVITVLATQVGRLGDMFGRVRMYEAGFIVFIAGSALCALASNETTIIVYRLIQGVGGALISANSGAVIADVFAPKERGRAYGYTAAGWSVGAILGILLGGVIITYVDWRWIFWINVPTGLVAFLLALRVLRDKGERSHQSLDLWGMLTFGAGVFGVLWAMTKLSTTAFSGDLAGFLIGGVVLLVVFVLVERRRRQPMVDLSLFAIPTVSPTMLASLFQAMANFAVLFLVIMYLQGVRGFSPLDASLVLVPGYLISGFVGPLGGKLTDRIGAVWPATVGLAIEVVSLVLYAQLATSTGVWVVVVASIVNGIGAGLFFPANTTAVMRAVPQTLFGVSSGMQRTFSNVGMVFSFAVAILVAARSIPRQIAFAIFVGTTRLSDHLAGSFVHGLHAAFYASIFFMALAALLSASRVLHTRKGRDADADADAHTEAVVTVPPDPARSLELEV